MAEPPRLRAELDEAELVAWGERIGRTARTPLILALDGELGAGKSTLARAVARGAGVTGEIPSPTYNLLFVYEGADGRRIHHLDLYRLERQDAVWELGWADLGAPGDVVLIEWAENAAGVLPAPRWEVTLEDAAGGVRRRVSASAVGDPPPLPRPGP